MSKKTDDVLDELDDDDLDEGQEGQSTKKSDEKGKEEYVPVDEKPEADDDHEDERLAPDNEDREDLRRRRREEKAERAARRKEAIARDKQQLDFLRRQNDELNTRLKQIEHKTATAEFVSLDARLKATQDEIRAAEHIIARAIEAGNGDDVSKAMRIRDEAVKKVDQLEHAKNTFKQRQQPAQAPQQPQANPVAAELAKDWMRTNSWYKPNAGDEKSDRVLEIDQGLANEGYNPATLEYWRELDKRVSQMDSEPKGSRRGPPLGSSREHAPRSTRNEVYVSPDRKQAMMDAGVWDDPAARQRYLKQYAKWDKENSSR
jgi:hypothetical protein